jgi:MOSC domain-containing protein YiiM
MEPRREVRAVPGRGLEGDRYHARNGRFSTGQFTGREITDVTLIESEVIDYLRLEWGLDASDEDSRRNLVTQGVALNDLVGAVFVVGGVRLLGAELCEPCVSLVKSPGHRHLLRALVHKGGLRARILTKGVIAVGDGISAPMPAFAATPPS